MVIASSIRSKHVSTRAAAGLLVLAAAAWAAVLLWHARSASVQHHLDAGREYVRNGEGKRAEQEWRQVVRMEPRSAVAWESLAELYASAEDWPAAARAFQELVRVDSTIPQLHGRLAVCLLRCGDERGAYREAEEELIKNPSDPSALTVAALLLSNMGEMDREAEYLRRLAKVQPDNVPVLVLLAENLTFTHNYQAARSVLADILRQDPNNAEAYSLRGLASLDEDQSPEGLASAEADFHHSLMLDPLAPFPRLYLGRLYRRKHEPQKAIFELLQASRLMPNKIDVCFELAGAYQDAGEQDEAKTVRRQFTRLRQEADLESSLLKRCALRPDSFNDNLQLGLLALRHSDYRKAGVFLTQAASLRPADKVAMAALERVRIATGGKDPQLALAAGAGKLAGYPGPGTQSR